MAQAKGSKSQIIIDEESTFKSDPGTPDCEVIPFKSESFTTTRNLFASESVRSGRNPLKPAQGNYEISGSLNLELNPFMGTFLKHLLGSVVTTGADPYVHTMKVGDLPTGIVLEKGFTDIGQYFKYNGCRVNKGSFSFPVEGIVELALDMMGAKETVSASSLDATPTTRSHSPFSVFEIGTLEEGGSAVAVIQEMSLDIENNLDGSLYVLGGGGERQEIPEGKVGVSGNLKALFSDMTMVNKAINFTETSVKVILTRGDGLGSVGNESLEIFLPELVYQQKSPVVEGDQGILVDLDFLGYYDDASEASSVQIILKNSIATY